MQNKQIGGIGPGTGPPSDRTIEPTVVAPGDGFSIAVSSFLSFWGLYGVDALQLRHCHDAHATARGTEPTTEDSAVEMRKIRQSAHRDGRRK
jgi:hypothetical protein